MLRESALNAGFCLSRHESRRTQDGSSNEVATPGIGYGKIQLANLRRSFSEGRGTHRLRDATFVYSCVSKSLLLPEEVLVCRTRRQPSIKPFQRIDFKRNVIFASWGKTHFLSGRPSASARSSLSHILRNKMTPRSERPRWSWV